MFQSFLGKANVLVFFSLLVSLAIIYFAPLLPAETKIPQNVFGFYVLLFPVGWLLLAAIFPKREHLSLLARMLISIVLSISINNLSLMVVFYFYPSLLGKELNVFLLLFFGIIFFAAWLLAEWRAKHGKE